MSTPSLLLRRSRIERLSMFVAEFCRCKLSVVGLVLLLLFLSGALLAPWIAPQNPYDLLQLSILDSRLPPGTRSSMGDYVYWLGTDDQGRDMVSAILYGLRISVMVGLIVTIIAAVIGCVLGAIAGFRGGRVDTLLMRLVDLQLSFPSILVALFILTLLGKGVWNVILAIVIVEWAIYARTMRGNAAVETSREYVEAAHNLAVPPWRIALRHVVPNCMAPISVVAALQCARAITLEATLSFLGIGVPITEPSLGLLVSNGYAYLMSGQYWISFYPGLMLVLLIVAINIVADRLRDQLNPRLVK